MRTPPSLLSLTIDSAILNLSYLSDLSLLPDHIVLDLFLGTLRAGKLNDRVLKMFVAAGKDEVLSLIEAFNIKLIGTPVLPTNIVIKHCCLENFRMMSQLNIKDSEIDIVIGALRSDLTSFMNEWRPIFSRYHLIIVKDPELKEDLQIPDGFHLDIYSNEDINRILGASSSIQFSGFSCRYFGYLMSKKKYIISIDDDCIPARDDKGFLIDVVAQHIVNLSTPATPFFFNTLYDPFRKGADFVRGYPFSLRSGVTCGLSCGLWLNLADYDAPTQALKPSLKNTRYVDAVLTIPVGAMLPVSGVNIAFNREMVGPALCPTLRLTGEGKFRWETMEDIWCGLCIKVTCDHLKLGVKSGLPYVWRNERGDAIESLKKEWEGVKLMEEIVPFFQSLRLPEAAATAEDCLLEIAKAVKEQLGRSDPMFTQAAESMVEWVAIWKNAGSGSSSAV